jgi:hypothetical protein
MNAEYPPAHPGSGPWWQSPRGWGQGRGASPSLTRGGLRGKFSCNAPLRGRLHHFLPPEVRDLRAGTPHGERMTSTRTAPEKKSIPESRQGREDPDVFRGCATTALRLPFLGLGPELIRAALAAAGCADCVPGIAFHTDLYVEQTCFSFGKSRHIKNTTCQMSTIRSW